MNLLTVKQVASKLACGASFIWTLTREDPTFPKPIQIGLGGERARGTRWVEAALDNWLLTKQQHPTDPEQKEPLNDDGRTGTELHQAA